ncbi:DUF6531 domain-containing protein [Bernardetia sp. MNP-M8]|uniref:DUF6531 domain-containing protein n=1 Tax=Bernardetia sp. MNP-M8 TaxID=3127470 RepID=UPI0030CBF862
MSTGITPSKVTKEVANSSKDALQGKTFSAIASKLFGEAQTQLHSLQAALGGFLPSIPGQPAGKFQDIAIGIDGHPTVFPPSPMLPVPHVGMVFDIIAAIFAAIDMAIPPAPEPAPVPEGEEPPPEPISVTSVARAIVAMMKPSVQVNNKWIANAGTPIQHLPGIILHALPVVAPMSSSEMFMGSATVLADGAPFSFQFLPALSCNLVGIPAPFRPKKPSKPKTSLMAPTSALLNVIPAGKPVLVGGPPMIDLFALAVNLGLKGLGKLWKRVGDKFQGLIDKIKKKHPKTGKILQFSKCKMFGEPVDAATGRVYANNEDFSLPGPIPLVWERTYYSDVEMKTNLGYNWHLSCDMGLWQVDQGFFCVRLKDAREIILPPLQVGDQFHQRQDKMLWFRDEKGYGLRTEEGLTHRFATQSYKGGFRPIRFIENDLGFRIVFEYNGQGHLNRIIDSAGRNIYVETDFEGRVKAVHTQNQNETIYLIRYDYDEEGNLAHVTDANGVTKHFEYQGRLLSKLTNQSGLSFYWEYDRKDEDAKCIHTWGDDGILEYWTKYEEGKTTTTNSLGQTTTYFYDAKSLIYRITDAKKGDTYQTYNLYDELSVLTDPDGNTTKYEYDKFGNIAKLTDANQKISTFEYDDQYRLLNYSSAGGTTLEWEYDEKGRLIKRIFPNDASLDFEYDGKLLHKMIDHKGKTTQFWWDEYANLSTVEHFDGTKSHWKYDELGNLLSSTDPKSNVTRFRYDKMSNVIELYEADGNHHIFEYDDAGNIIRAKDDNREVTFTYWGLGLLKSRSENGHTVIFDYDKEEQLKTITNEKGESYRFTRDGVGDVIGEWGFDGLQRRYHRTLGGRVTRVLRPAQRWTSYHYDGVGNILTSEQYDGYTEFFTYNDDGILVEAANPTSTVQYKRDDLGRVIEESQNEHSIKSKYDDEGNRILVTSSLGASIQNSFNSDGSLSQIDTKEGWQSRFERDSLGLELARYTTGNVEVHTQRDNLGRVTLQNIQGKNVEGSRKRYFWSKGNRLDKILNEGTGQKTEFDYDVEGNLLSADYNGVETIYKMPDAIGNLFKSATRSDRKYNKGGKLVEDETYFYEYDEEGNLQYKTARKAAKPKVVRSLLAEDHERAVKEAPSSLQRWTYHWYGNGMLKGVVKPSGEHISFEYDALGRRTAKINHTAKSMYRYVWDGNVILHEWKYGLSERPSLSVNEKGELSSEQPEPTENIVTWVYEEGSFVPSAKLVGKEKYSIISNYLGTPESAYDSQGNKVWEREIDIYGTVKKGDSIFVPFLYQGQYFDSETDLAYNRFRYYSPETGTYISQDPISLLGGDRFYAYVHNTNKCVDVFGLYNGEGVRDLDAYNSFHNHQLANNEFLLKDTEHFSKANESLHNKFQNHPEFAAKMEAKYPGITKHVAPTRRGTHRGTAPKGTTWHHATSSQAGGKRGILQLVDMSDHAKYHKIYHPEDIGGRNEWGGGTSCRK